MIIYNRCLTYEIINPFTIERPPSRTAKKQQQHYIRARKYFIEMNALNCDRNK